jgi:hypothetical protein
MTIAQDRLSELVRLERQCTPDGPRIERGWQRLQAAVSAGVEVGADLSAAKLLKISALSQVARRALKPTIGVLALAAAAGFWLHSGYRTAYPNVSESISRRVAVDQDTIRKPRANSAPADAGLHTESRTTPTLDILAPASVPRSAGVTPSSDAAAKAGGFEKELALIKAAKLELDQGHTAASLSLLNQHAKSYPKGIFAGEREALRLLATCESLPPVQRQRLSRDFARTNPSSPYVDRVRSTCSNATAKTGP